MSHGADGRHCRWLFRSRLCRCRTSGTLAPTFFGEVDLFHASAVLPTFLFIVFSLAMIVPIISRAPASPISFLSRWARLAPTGWGFWGPRRRLLPTSTAWLGRAWFLNRHFRRRRLRWSRTRRFCPELILKQIAPANLEAGWLQLFRLFPISSTHGATARLHLSGQSHWIRKTGSLPASIAAFQLMTPDFSLSGRHPARPIRLRVRRRRSWLAAPPG